MLPFSKLVWIAGASLTLLVAVILASEYFLTKKISIYPYKEKHAATADLITMVMSTVCQQGKLEKMSLVQSKMWRETTKRHSLATVVLIIINKFISKMKFFRYCYRL